MTQRTKFKLVIYFILLMIGISLVIWLFLHNNAVKRDYERISDMRQLQSRWLEYFGKFSTFEVPDCNVGRLISSCTGNNERLLDVSGLNDPLGKDQYYYVLEDLSQLDFTVGFYLETKIGNLLPGKYLLTSQGINSAQIPSEL